MGFWEPVKIDEDTQLKLDRCVIVRLGKEKLIAQRKKVEARAEKQGERLKTLDHSNTTQRKLNKLRSDYDFTIKELNTINRRIEICEEYLK